MKDSEKGPLVWESKHVAFYPRDTLGLPGERLHLIVARNVLCKEELKYFVSNAPEASSMGEMLLVAFTRWTVERCFEDEKMELGFDHFEGRSYLGLKRHQAICALTHLFLAETRQMLREKNLDVTLSQLKLALAALVLTWWVCPDSVTSLIDQAAKQIQYYQKSNARAAESHTKTRLSTLDRLGIRLRRLPHCQWDSS